MKTVDEFIDAMNVIDAGHDGSTESASRARHLYNVLMKEPNRFWQEWGDSLERMNVQRAEQALIEMTRQSVHIPDFSEVRELIRSRAMRQKEQNGSE